MSDIKYHLFRSKKDPTKALTVGEYDNGFYFLPGAVGQIPPEENVFASIEEIELIVGDELELIIKKDTEH